MGRGARRVFDDKRMTGGGRERIKEQVTARRRCPAAPAEHVFLNPRLFSNELGEKSRGRRPERIKGRAELTGGACDGSNSCDLEISSGEGNVTRCSQLLPR